MTEMLVRDRETNKKYNKITIDSLVDIVSTVIDTSMEKLSKNHSHHVMCCCDHSTALISLSLLKYRDNDHTYLSAKRTIHIIMFQDIPSRNISVSIINGENHKQKILYRVISMDPSISVEKYLTSIIDSMIKILEIY